MRTYVITHPHARQKKEAIASLEVLITALGLNIEIPAAGDRPFQALTAQILHSEKTIRATVKVERGPELDLKWLEIIDD